MTTGTCRICGQPGDGRPFEEWVADTFTNRDRLHPGEIICDGCYFWFAQRSPELTARMGKDKLQRMQNYSHFVVRGEWQPLSKGDKPGQLALLLSEPFPELAAVAVSGQKHLAFRARRNPPGSRAGWVQFEEQALYVEPAELRALSDTIYALMEVFSKGEIESGNYLPHRILAFGLARWRELEAQIAERRASALFGLALFLTTRRDNGDRQSDATGSGSAHDHLAGGAAGLQAPLLDDDLDTVRKRDQVGRVHEQPGQVRQLALFEAELGPGDDGG